MILILLTVRSGKLGRRNGFYKWKWGKIYLISISQNDLEMDIPIK